MHLAQARIVLHCLCGYVGNMGCWLWLSGDSRLDGEQQEPCKWSISFTATCGKEYSNRSVVVELSMW